MAKVEVVHHDEGDVEVPPRRVDEVIPADGQGIAVANEDNHLGVGLVELDARGPRKGAAVDAMEAVHVEVHRYAGGAPYPTDAHHGTKVQAKGFNGPEEGAEYLAAAAGAKSGAVCPVSCASEGVPLLREGWIRS